MIYTKVRMRKGPRTSEPDIGPARTGRHTKSIKESLVEAKAGRFSFGPGGTREEQNTGGPEGRFHSLETFLHKFWFGSTGFSSVQLLSHVKNSSIAVILVLGTDPNRQQYHHGNISKRA